MHTIRSAKVNTNVYLIYLILDFQIFVYNCYKKDGIHLNIIKFQINNMSIIFSIKLVKTVHYLQVMAHQINLRQFKILKTKAVLDFRIFHQILLLKNN